MCFFLQDILRIIVILLLLEISFTFTDAIKQFGSFDVFRNSGYPEGTEFLKEKLDFDVSTANPTRCATLCMYTPNCIGYFFRENEFCRLVSTYKRSILTTSPGTHYYQATSQCKLIPNLCHVGQCISNSNDDSYTCQCPQGITGKHCTEGIYLANSDDKDAKYSHVTTSCWHANAYGSVIYNNDGRFTQAYRFRLDGVPRINTMTSAKLFLTINKASGAFSYHIKIKAMKVADSGTTDIEECTFRDDRLRTATQVIWSGHNTTTVGDVIETPDISTVLKEVISMSGWTPGNHVDIIFFNDDLQDTAMEGYQIRSGRADTEDVPRLVITFG